MNHRLVLLFSITITNIFCSTPAYVPPRHTILTLYQMMKDAHEILTYNDVPYFVHAGTLLGAVRHTGLIPWDDDLDIVILKSDESAFLQLTPLFKKYGYEIVSCQFGYKIFLKNGTPTVWNFKFPWIDVMIFDKVGNAYKYDPARNPPEGWRWINFKIDDLFPLKDYKFGSFYVKGPKNPFPYLDRVYPRWRTIAQVHNHAQSNSSQRPLTPQDKRPAHPMGPLKNRVLPNKNKKIDSLSPQLNNTPFTIEPLEKIEVHILAQLIEELGFTIDENTLEEKITTFMSSKHDKIFVAKVEDRIVGLLAINIIVPLYHPDNFARIDTIVVNHAYRNLGIGNALIHQAENYAKTQECTRVFLSSGNHRSQAHEFFRSCGYVTNATYFVKTFDKFYYKLLTR